MNILNGEWLNQPKQYEVNDKEVSFVTEQGTDFWQKTNYGYQRNSGHVYLFDIEKDNYTFLVKASFQGKYLYDQCGIMVYNDPEHWAKASLENANEIDKMLGAVVTNHGYSDWSVSQTYGIDVESIYYKVHKKGSDFLIEASLDNQNYIQLRMFHLSDISKLRVGVYACSPLESSCKAYFQEFEVLPLQWDEENYI
ncbi:MAG: DUF1349 domain-containing protein [Coprobacillus sp.]